MQLSVIAGLTGPEVGVLVAVVAASMIVGFIVRVLLEHLKRDSLDKELQADKNAARAEGGKIVAQAEAQAKSELISHREQFGAETESTRKELRAEEKRLGKRADLIDQKLETLQSKERMIEAAEKGIHERERALANKDRQLNELIGQQKSQLLKVANLTIEEARKAILERVEKDMEEETAELIQKRIDRRPEKS